METATIKRILSLDPATTTGWCVLEFATDSVGLCIMDYGFFVVDISSKYEGDHCLSMKKEVKELISKWKIDVICLENYYFSRNAKQGANKNLFLRAAIIMLCREFECKVHYEFISVFDWKKFICGRSTPPPEVKKKYKTTANKMMTVISLWDKFKLQFPNRFPRSAGCCSQTTKPLVFKTDISDSIAIGVYFCYKQYFGLFNVDIPIMDCTNYYHKYNDNNIPTLGGLDYSI